MKKIYSKPQIVFDSFELSQSIAAGCDYIQNHAKNICKITSTEPGCENLEIFSVGVCFTTPPGVHDEICYDVPFENEQVFSS